MLDTGRTDELAVEPDRPLVMVVDDDDEIREALVDVLLDRDYRVVAAADGQQALERLRAGPRPGAIFFDLWMPVMDGWQLLEA
ncbi:MAG TPA: response regulator, partial [Polyangiaceae bacterium]|nr:response regulator [Polyangiaceae bacterium]